MREVAEKAGVSESMVSQIERNRVSPAIDTLLAIADTLDMDLDYLFADFKRDRGVTVIRSGEGDSFTRPGVLYKRLAQMDAQAGIEAYLITIEAGAKTGNDEYGHQGWELGMVESGHAELTIGNAIYQMEAGDSVSFKSDSPHVLANRDTELLRMIWVITPPKGKF
jgi:DNA-binding XRE family transcriptional regulator/mannose-6-phosphate isomerase-like protein (cupin superfamily)